MRWATAFRAALTRFRQAFPGMPTSRRWSLPAASPPTARSRRHWSDCAATAGFAFVAPPLKLCTDNAAMIAWAGIERLRAGMAHENGLDFVPRSRWPLDSISAPMVGSGRRGAKA